jgi:hypothetical protein
VDRCHHDVRVFAEYGFGAIAVMNIEIDHDDALESVHFASLLDANRNIIEDAESHGGGGGSMMARRALRTKRVLRLAAKHGVYRRTDGACRAHKCAG